jgi:hypothetical protein
LTIYQARRNLKQQHEPGRLHNDFRQKRQIMICRICVVLLGIVASAFAATTPATLMPVPSANQMAWQKAELLFFTHFGLQTFTGSNKATGNDDTNLFI